MERPTDCMTMSATIRYGVEGKMTWCCEACHSGTFKDHVCTTGRVAGIDRDITLCHEMWDTVKKIWEDD